MYWMWGTFQTGLERIAEVNGGPTPVILPDSCVVSNRVAMHCWNGVGCIAHPVHSLRKYLVKRLHSLQVTLE